MRPFKKDLIDYRNFSFDITNTQEMIAGLLVFAFEYYLLFTLLYNIRKILLAYFNTDTFNPGKLLSINFILLITVIVRLIATLYAVIGCLMSNFNEFSNQYTGKIFFNIYIYQSLQIIYISTENVGMLLASHFWLNAINNKITVEGDGLSGSSLRLQTQKGLQIFENLLKYAWLLVLCYLITSLVLCNHDTDDKDISSIQQQQYSSQNKVFQYLLQLAILFVVYYLQYLAIFYSGILNLFIKLIRNLIKRYSFQFRQNIQPQIRWIGITLIATQFFRLIMNILYITQEQWMKEIKTGQENNFTLPDKTYNWCFIYFFYRVIVDFYPTYRLSYLFSPFDKKDDQKKIYDSESDSLSSSLHRKKN